MYASIDAVADKIERQIRSSKENLKGQERASQRLLPDVGDDDDGAL
jgi:ribosome-associated translation inhibitor RaiA